MPDGTVYVGRPTRWGNPFAIGETMTSVPSGVMFTVNDELAVALYRMWIFQAFRLGDFLAPLRGHDLACWCPLDEPCHADVLLELANA